MTYENALALTWEQACESPSETEEREASYLELQAGDASYAWFEYGETVWEWESEDWYSLAPEWLITPSYLEV